MNDLQDHDDTDMGRGKKHNSLKKETCLVNLPSSYVIITGQLDIHKALIVSKIQVHLSTKKRLRIHNFF